MRASCLLALALVGAPLSRSEETPAKGWVAEVAFTASAKLCGCVVADVNPRLKGPEIVVVASSGEVVAVGRSGSKWKSEVMAKVPGEMIQCAAGDLDPKADGDEVVAVGMASGTEAEGGPGAAHVLRWTGKAWVSQDVFRDTALIHGACVADLDPRRPGNEILVVGFSTKATMLYRKGDGWEAELAADLGAAGKNAIPFDGGAAVACTSGRLLHVKKTPDGWTSVVLDEAPSGLSRLGTDGERIVAARDDGSIGLVALGSRVDLYKEDRKLRGAVIGDLDPSVPGLEVATGGYRGKVVVLFAEPGGWREETVFLDTDAIHHVAAGELLEEGAGLELVSCGFSRRLVVIRRGR